MGLASKWFRGLFGLKKSDSSSATAAHSIPKPPNRRWSFVKSYREKQTNTTNQEFSRETPNGNGNDTNKHAIAVAVATAAVAEAALATAQAANAVVKLTSAGRSSSKRGSVNNTTAAHASISSLGIREEYAAVKIQSIFRAYLSRRALKALKALVKLQALVRGHFVRKRTSDMMRRMQALIRAQTRARIGRSQVSDSPLSKSSKFRSPYLTSPTILFEFESSKDPLTPEKIDHSTRAKSRKHQPSLLKRNSSSYVRDGPIDNEKGDKILKILEVDHTGKPQINPKRRNLFQPSSSEQNSHSHNRSQSHSFTTSRGSTIYQTVPSPSSCEVNSLSPLIYVQDLEEISFHTAGNTPHYYSASSKGNSWTKVPFTPSKSDRSRSCLSDYLDHPNYMSYTESSKAKVRSLSAPRQRTQSEISGVTKRYSLYGYGDSRLGPRRVSDMHVNFASKVYPGSGRLDRIGMPVGGGDLVGFSGEILNIY